VWKNNDALPWLVRAFEQLGFGIPLQAFRAMRGESRSEALFGNAYAGDYELRIRKRLPPAGWCAFVLAGQPLPRPQEAR
jgi:hypothetical protein